MPVLPYSITGLIYDTDSTVLGDAIVRVINIRTAEVLTTTSQSDGSYSVVFTAYENKDMVFVDARKTISTTMEKYGVGVTEIDTDVVGKDVNITVNLRMDMGIETILLRAPQQDRDIRVFSPEFNALRTVETGMDCKQATITRDANNFISTIEESDGIHTKKTTFTRDTNNYITSIEERIK
jgi:hypothetical protein